MLFVDAPAESPVHRWASTLTATLDACAFAADDPSARARAERAQATMPALRTIACLPLDTAHFLGIPPGATELVGVRADAYASDARTFAQGLAFVLAEDRALRERGPLRLVLLGPLGMEQGRPAAGTTVALDPTCTRLGRAEGCTLRLPQGHSDQSNIARVHALIEPGTLGALQVRDAGTSNGTWLRGERLDATAHTIGPGDELALCGLLRIRLDGAVG